MGMGVFYSYVRLRIFNREHVPREGPVILIANHTSLLDGILIHAPTWRPLRIFVAAEWAAWWPVRGLFRLAGPIVVDREKTNPEAFEAALEALARGDAVSLFPEGGIQVGDGVGAFRPGAARLAFRSGAPVVPIAIIGARSALPWERVLPRPRPITIRCGAPLRFQARADGKASTDEMVAATAMMREAMVRLLAEKG